MKKLQEEINKMFDDMIVCGISVGKIDIYGLKHLQPNEWYMVSSGYPFLPIDGSDNATKDIEFDDGYYTLPKDTQLDFTGLTYPEFQKQFQGNWSDSVTKECEHDWKEYVGLVESYKYCSKCDKKG